MESDVFGLWRKEGPEQLRVREILSSINDNKINNILDYGCGTGSWTETLIELFPGASVAGVDISPVALASARERYPDMDLRVSGQEGAPFDCRSFDLVFSYHVLEHVENLKITAADICSLTRHGGYACIILPCGNRGSLEEKVSRISKDGLRVSSSGERVFSHEDPTHLRRMDSQEVIQLFEAEGAQLQLAYYANHFLGTINFLIYCTSKKFIKNFFDPARGKTLSNKVKLAIYRAWVMAFFLPGNLASMLPVVDLDTPRPRYKQAAANALMILRKMGHDSRKVTDRLARIEWALAKKRKSGSAQYLLFKVL